MSDTRKPRVATVWLGGCAGCHMSFLDIDEWAIELADLVDVVYSPIADVKEFPEDVDFTLVEGALCNEENLHILKDVRSKTKVLIAFGDCAVTGNVPAMRNPMGSPMPILKAVYKDRADIGGQVPEEEGIVPPLLNRVRPLHEVVTVDLYLHGCPPSAKDIRAALEAALGLPSGFEQSAVKFG